MACTAGSFSTCDERRPRCGANCGSSLARSYERLAVDLLRRQRCRGVGDGMLGILARLKRDNPLRVAVGRHDDVGMPDRVIASFDPPSPVTIVAAGAFAPKAHQIDLGVPLAVPLTDRTFRIEGAVPRLKRDDVEGVRAVRPFAVNDVTGVSDRFYPWRRTNDRTVAAVALSALLSRRIGMLSFANTRGRAFRGLDAANGA